MIYSSQAASSPPSPNWQLGYATNQKHVCKPNDSSTWKQVSARETNPGKKLLYQCKGCTRTMFRSLHA